MPLATQELKKSPKQDNLKPTSADALIRYNGELVEQLLSSKAWEEIVLPLLQESIAGVSGRYTNGRYWHGGLTTKWDGTNSIFYAAYQKALMDFNNNLHDFILAKNKLEQDKKNEVLDNKAPLYNPFMEEESDN